MMALDEVVKKETSDDYSITTNGQAYCLQDGTINEIFQNQLNLEDD